MNVTFEQFLAGIKKFSVHHRGMKSSVKLSRVQEESEDSKAERAALRAIKKEGEVLTDVGEDL